MNKKFGYAAFVFAVVSMFVPIGYSNNEWITVLPIYGNMEFPEIGYQWITIGAFAVTFVIVALLLPYFNSKENKFALNILGGIMIVCVFFFAAALFITFHEASKAGINTTSYGYGFFTLIAAIILCFLSAVKLKK